ncbi:MAG: sodium-coupled permease [Bacteroidetes bacterium]|nr:sodium-coupled permease [Bacteroidota bacterium]
MSFFDWLIVLLFFAYIMWDGIRQNQHTNKLEDLLVAGRTMPWWAIGTSILATQASAISFIGTTGLAYMHDMSFIQIYLGLPLAMVILCITLVPFYHKLKIYTAYEALEQRFGLRVRLLTSLLFLLSRGFALGITVAAPSYVLALILNVPLSSTILIIGLSATVYTMVGGITGVIRTDVKQMILMFLGLVFCFVWIVMKLPPEISFGQSLQLAGTLGKLETLDLNFNLGEKYNIWSGLFAGLFLMLSYFGCDQSQVQRYLTANSLKDARASLIMAALTKIPFMFLILLLGVLLYVFYIFEKPPLMFSNQSKIDLTDQQLRNQHQTIFEQRKLAAYQLLKNTNEGIYRSQFLQADQRLLEIRKQVILDVEEREGSRKNDTNYILPYFILHEMPIGFIGLIVAAILAAALSSIDSGLNSLATSSIMDWQARLFQRQKSDQYYLTATRIATAFWGLFAIIFALILGETDSIIELINKIGSYFYGAILGVFVLLWIKKTNGMGAFYGLLIGIAAVLILDQLYYHQVTDSYQINWDTLFRSSELYGGPGVSKTLSYLWLNPIGCGCTVVSGYLLSLIPFSKT